jgi:hypothetical protein
MSVLADGPIFDSPSEKPARYWTYEGGRRYPRTLSGLPHPIAPRGRWRGEGHATG